MNDQTKRNDYLLAIGDLPFIVCEIHGKTSDYISIKDKDAVHFDNKNKRNFCTQCWSDFLEKHLKAYPIQTPWESESE